MHITRYTDYSLRVLIYLAAEGDRLATIQEIADSYDISKNHLMKVVQVVKVKVSLMKNYKRLLITILLMIILQMMMALMLLNFQIDRKKC